MKKVFLLSFVLLWMSGVAFAQTRTVTGQVDNAETGETLAGASITLKGTTRGVVSGPNGKFSISVPSNNAVLVVYSVGFGRQEFPVGDQADLTIKLSPVTASVDEVVVVGYGERRKRDLTGALTSISRKTLHGPTLYWQLKPYRTVAGATVTKASTRPALLIIYHPGRKHHQQFYPAIDRDVD